MINQIHARFHRPEKGWDPIAPDYAQSYGDIEWQSLDQQLMSRLEEWIGGFEGKKILDLGSGPGQYAVAFASRGALVTCHDVSRTYLEAAQKKAIEFKVSDRMIFSVGYLDEAPELLATTYDLVFNRVCWYYGFGDRSFAEVVFRLVSPGGYCYVDTPHCAFNRGQLSASARFRMWLNCAFSIKIGHPFPPHGRLARLFLRHAVQNMTIDYSDAHHDRIWFRKSAATP